MATASSGAFETSAYNVGEQYPNRIRVEWSSSQSVANNTSTIYWTVKSAGGYDGWYVMAGPITVNIAGVNVYSRSDRFELHANTTLGSGSFTLTHNTDGTKSFIAGAEAAIYTYAISSTRYGYSVDLPQIPRASSISVSGSTMNSPLTISISKASPSFTHTITWEFEGASGTLAKKTSESLVSWTPPLDLAYQIPDDTSGRGTICCTTWSGNSNVGTTSINFTLTLPPDVKQHIKKFDLSIASTKPSGCDMYVKNNSTVKLSALVNGEYGYGSTIKKCVISGPNLSYESNDSSNSYSAISSTLTTFGDKTYTITITDSRGRTDSRTETIRVVDYNSPVITSYTSFRSNSNGSMNSSGTYITHKITPSFYPLNGKNIAKIIVYSKKSTDSAYGNATIITNSAGNQKALVFTHTTQTFEIDSTYDFKIVISDSVGNSATIYTHVGTKNIPLNIASNNKSVAVGGFAQTSTSDASKNDGRFDCFWDAHFASSPIVASDRNLKHNIQDINIDIINLLRPVQYQLIRENSGATHYGFIAQDVEQALIDSGVSQKTGIVHYDEDNSTKERVNYALAYDEVIPLLVKKCQDLQKEIDELKNNNKPV